MIKEIYKERISIQTSWANPPASQQAFVAIIHFSQEKIGFIYNENRNSWEFPGGKIEATDASLIDAARREYSEETGLVAPENLKYCFTAKNIPIEAPDRYSFCHFFRCETETEPNNCNRFCFYKEIPDNTSFESTVYKIILDEIYSLDSISLKRNLNAWETISLQYLSKTRFSCEDIHFGPCIPGNSQLKLIEDIKDLRVLDLGCGLGHNSIALSRSGAKVCAVDFSSKQLSQAVILAKSFQQNIDFYCSDFRAGIAHAGNHLSLVLSVFSLQFSNDLRGIFEDVYNALIFGGSFVFSIPHPAEVLSESQGVKIIEKDWGNGIYMSMRYYSLEYLLSALKDSGFTQCLAFEPPSDITDLTVPYSSEYYIQNLGCRVRPYTLIISAKKYNVP